MVKKRASLLMLNRWITRLCGGLWSNHGDILKYKEDNSFRRYVLPDCMIKDTFGIVRIVPCYIRGLNKVMSERWIKASYRWFVQKNALKVQIRGYFGMKKRYFSQKINIFLENHAKFLNLSAKQRKSLQNHLKIC